MRWWQQSDVHFDGDNMAIALRLCRSLPYILEAATMSQVATLRLVSCTSQPSVGMRCAVVRHCVTSSKQQRLASLRFMTTTTRLPRRRQSTTTSSFQRLQHAGPPVARNVRDSLQSFLLKPRTVPVPRWISPQHYTITLSEVLGHSSFILVATSYAVDDFLQLRIIAVAGSTAMLFFTYFHPFGKILWLPFKWNVLFIAINSYRIGKVYLRRLYAENLSEELLAVRNNHFYVLDPVDFYKLVTLGRTETFRKGDLVVAQGNLNRYIRMVVDGELEAIRDGVKTYSLEEGNFVSECGLHAGLLLYGKVESCCTIVAAKKTTVVCWDRNELMDFLSREKATRSALKAALSWDIVRKLKGQRQVLAQGQIEDPELWTQKRNEQTKHRYAAILRNMLYHPQYLEDRKEELNKYRMIHHIDDESHKEALQQCGWTVEEFKAGFKEGFGQETDEDDEIKHDFKWLVNDIYLRVFG